MTLIFFTCCGGADAPPKALGPGNHPSVPAPLGCVWEKRPEVVWVLKS